MAVSYERRHLPFRTWFHKRLPGYGGDQEENCCLLLEDDPGDGSSELLLESDTTGQSCLQPEDC